MRRLLALALLVGAALSSRADVTVLQKTEGAMNSGELRLRIRGDKARVDVAAQLTVITDLATGDAVTLNHNSKLLVRISGADATRMRSVTAGVKPDSPAPVLTPAGRKEKIGDHECDVYTWKVGILEVTDWVAPAYPAWQPVMKELQRFQSAGLAGAAQPLMPPLEQFPGMVLKREMKLRDTKTTSILVSVNTDAVDEKLFVIPEGYKEQPSPKIPE